MPENEVHTVNCVKKNPTYKKLSRELQMLVSKKIRKLMNEGYTVKQAAAMAISMARAGKLGPRGGYHKNPSFPVKWISNKNETIWRADLMDFRKTKIVVIYNDKGNYKAWTWEMTRSYPNGDVVDDGDTYESSEEAKQDALKFYDETITLKNPIEDKDVLDCVKALTWLSRFPHHFDKVDQHILEAVEFEKLYSHDKGVTGSGMRFLDNWEAMNE